MAGMIFMITIPTTPINDGSESIFNSSDPEDNFVDCPKQNSLLDIASDSSMETILNELFRKLNIVNSVWQTSRDGLSHHITFSIEADHRYKLVLTTLDEWGIGQRQGSSVSAIPCTVYNCPPTDKAENNKNDLCEEWILSQKQTAWERFLASVRARLNVAQIVEAVKEDASLTFDFVTLIIVASSLASLGLIGNNIILLVSSMLISPLMNPIVATIFGIVIEDRPLIRFGWANEMFGVLLATIVGLGFGLIVYTFDLYGHGGNAVVTDEMLSQCETRSLIVGILTALASGAAVAIAILGANIGSLVGVAISASILPPAVNTGIFWSLAILHSFHVTDNQTLIETQHYSDDQAIELAVHGAFSMLLTAANIACILLMGVFVLKIKEVAPIATKQHRQFWTHDIKLARNYNLTRNADEDEFTRKLADEISELHCQTGVAIEADFGAGLLRNITRKSYQNTWSPSCRNTIANAAAVNDRRPSLADLEKIYTHLTVAPTKYDRLRMPVCCPGVVNKSFVADNLSPPNFTTFSENNAMAKGSRGRRKSPPLLSTSVTKGNQLEIIAEINQNASTSTVFETLPATSTSTSDDSTSAHTMATITTTGTSKPKKAIRKFVVTPATEPF